jgi:C4-dicarboxylate transporter DctM subunit
VSIGSGIALIITLMVVHLAIGLPLFVVLGLGSLAIMLWADVYSLSAFGEAPFQAIDSWALLAMPLFILAGDIVSSGRMAKAIVRLGNAALGWVRGGLGMTTIAACFFLSGTSGSNAADTAAVGRIMIPRLVEHRYPVDYAAALAAAGGCLGIIVPPSIMFIIYGVVTSTSVGDLFIAGVLPGLVMTVLMCAAVYLECRARGVGTDTSRFSGGELLRALWESKFTLGAPVIILGGIYTGVFTPTEAAAVAVFYCLLVELLVNRSFGLRALPTLLARSGTVIGVIAPIIVFSLLFGEVISIVRLPEAIAATFLSYAADIDLAKVAILALLIVVGCFMETIAAIIILMPIVFPIVKTLGIDPVHFGVFVICALTVGFITPPVGLNLFVAAAISGRPYMLIAMRVIPLFIALLTATVIVGWVPWLALWFR